MYEMGPGRRYAVRQPGLAAEPVGHWLVVGLQLETEIQIQVKLKQDNCYDARFYVCYEAKIENRSFQLAEQQKYLV